MASIAVENFSVVRIFEDGGYECQMNAHVAARQGKCFYVNTSNKAVIADASTSGGVGTLMGLAATPSRTNLANESVTLLRHAEVFVGATALSGLAYGAPVYASDTAGEITGVVGESTEAVQIGYVIGVNRDTLGTDKLLLVDTRHLPIVIVHPEEA